MWCRWKPIWSDLQEQIESAFNSGSDAVLNKSGADGVSVFLQYNFKTMSQVYLCDMIDHLGCGTSRIGWI